MALVNERIKELRTKKGLTLLEVADRLGVKEATAQRYESGMIKNIKHETIDALASILGCHPGYLLGWSKSPNPTPSTVPAEPTWSKPLDDAYASAEPPTQKNVCTLLDIPHIIPFAPVQKNRRRRMTSKIVFIYPPAAGLPLYAESDFERKDFPTDEIPDGADFALHVSGDSMEPTIADSQLIWIKKQQDIKDGEIGIFMIGDSATCKRARVRQDGRLLRLESDNPAHNPIEGEDLTDTRCVGKVLL